MSLSIFAEQAVSRQRAPRPFASHKRPYQLVLLLVLGCGMILEITARLFEFAPETFFPGYLGSADGLRLRLFRLARVAAFALPVLAVFFEQLSSRTDPYGKAASRGRGAMLFGAVAMPAVLAAAAFSRVELRMLLPLPASATLFGTLCGLSLSVQHNRRFETLGWLSIALSMSAGMFMGLYAFDLPFEALNFMGGYNDPVRRLIRLAHVGFILSGFAVLFFCRAAEKRGVAP